VADNKEEAMSIKHVLKDAAVFGFVGILFYFVFVEALLRDVWLITR
jgi:hypothetical protein